MNMDISPADTVRNAEHALAITRVFKAPRELVFDVWTQPEHVAQWWGPRGFTTTIHEMDVRPGGLWRFIMHGPDGVDYGNRILFLEVVRPERLVYEHGEDIDNDPGRFLAMTLFEEEEGGTRITLKMTFASAEILEKMKEFGAVEGGNETLDCLGEYLARM